MFYQKSMKEKFYFQVKDCLLKAVLLVAVCWGGGSVSAQSGFTKEDPLVLEGGQVYDVSGHQFKNLYATFTAPSDGILSLKLVNTDRLDVYTDNTYESMVEPRLTYVNNVCEMEVKVGETYFLATTFLLNANKIAVEFGKEGVPVELKSISPAEGEMLSATDALVSFAFNKEVDYEEATLTVGTHTQKINPVSVSTSVLFDLGAVMMAMYENGILRGGDDMVITLKGVRDANKANVLYGTDGTCSVTLKAQAKPVELASTTNTPGSGMDVFKSYIMAGKQGMVQLQFDGALDVNKKPVASLVYGDFEAENGFYKEELDVQFFGDNMVAVKVFGKLRRHQDMLPSYSGGAFDKISLKISGLYSADGQLVYSGLQGSAGSCAFQYGYEEVKADISVLYDDLETSESIDGLDSLTIWVMGDEYVKYSGVQFDFVVNGKIESVVVKDIKKIADKENEGASYLKVCVPMHAADADSKVKVSFVGLEATDGLDYSSDFAAEFTTKGKNVDALAITASTPTDGETLEALKGGTFVKVSTNRDKEIQSMIYEVFDVTTNENVKSMAYMTKTKDGFEGEVIYDCQMYEGHDYEIRFRAYSDVSSRVLLGELSVKLHGAAKAFEASPVKLLEITPNPETTVLTSEADSIVVMKFNAPVVITDETAFIISGQGGTQKLRSLRSNADKTEWRLVIPEYFMKTYTAIYMSVTVKDENGMVVLGNAGVNESSYFNLCFDASYNAPDMLVTPADGAKLTSIKEVVFGYAGGINELSAGGEKVEIWDRMRNLVATAVSMELVIPEGKEEDFTYVPTEIKVTFDREVTEPGAYIVHVPASTFTLGEQFDSKNNKETFVNYIIEGEAPQTFVPVEVQPVMEGNAISGFLVKNPSTVTLDEATFDPSTIKIVNTATGKEVEGGRYATYVEAWEDFSIVLENPLTEIGTYTLTLPAGMFGSDTWIPGGSEGTCNPELVYTVVLTENGATVGVKPIAVGADAGKVTVYTLNGVQVLYQADREALKTLNKGIYIVNGKKVVVK